MADLAARLREARDAAGLTQQQVAESLGVRRPAIAEIEAGARAVKSDELVQLAALYGRSIPWLLQGEIQEEDQLASVLYRATVVDPRMRREVARLARRCRIIVQLEDRLDSPLPMPSAPQYSNPDAVSDQGAAMHDGHRVAYLERARLGIGPNAPLRDPWGIVEDAGLHVFSLELGPDHETDGIFARTSRGAACVGVNTDKWVFRQVFTVVHEYGHALMDSDIAAENCATQYAWKTTGAPHIAANRELRANQFAAVFLVPREALLGFFAARGKLAPGRIPRARELTALEIVRGQDHFGVSGEMLLWRLRNEDLISGTTRRELADELRRRGTQTLARTLGYDWRRFAQPFGRSRELALRAYAAGEASLGTVAELFGRTKEDMLEALRGWGVHPEFSQDDALIGGAN
ncbi:MAG: helix-turn-helix domain-containing protein [Longimicrobiales bacterium]